MFLHRDLADAEFSTHLPVQQSGYHQCHRFPFAASKRSIRRSKCLQLAFAAKRSLAARDGMPDRIQQYFVIEWVSQEFQSSAFHSFHRHGYIAKVDVVRHESDYLAITTVVQELLSLGKSRFAAMRISSRGRSPRMIGQ